MRGSRRRSAEAAAQRYAPLPLNCVRSLRSLLQRGTAHAECREPRAQASASAKAEPTHYCLSKPQTESSKRLAAGAATRTHAIYTNRRTSTYCTSTGSHALRNCLSRCALGSRRGASRYGPIGTQPLSSVSCHRPAPLRFYLQSRALRRFPNQLIAADHLIIRAQRTIGQLHRKL